MTEARKIAAKMREMPSKASQQRYWTQSASKTHTVFQPTANKQSKVNKQNVLSDKRTTLLA
jgi:hypothetical protein